MTSLKSIKGLFKMYQSVLIAIIVTLGWAYVMNEEAPRDTSNNYNSTPNNFVQR